MAPNNRNDNIIDGTSSSSSSPADTSVVDHERVDISTKTTTNENLVAAATTAAAVAPPVAAAATVSTSLYLQHSSGTTHAHASPSSSLAHTSSSTSHQETALAASGHHISNDDQPKDFLSYLANRDGTVTGKRKHANTLDPESDGGLELLFAASLIQQKDEYNRRHSGTKAMSSCSENESTAAESGVHEVPLENVESSALVEPSDLDVLAGRGGRVNQHVGNVVYRKVVDYNKAIYKQVPKRHRILVSRSIVQTIQKHGGRFLQPVNVQGKQNQAWACIPYRRAVQKTSQALREPMADAMDPSITGESAASDSSKAAAT